MLLSDQVRCLEHVIRERGDGFACFLDGLNDVCRIVELNFDVFLYGVEHLRETE